MADSNSSADSVGGVDRRVARRTVLEGLGTGAIAGLGLVGTARGHWVRGTPLFCGCDQLCVCVAGNADVLVARETDDGSEVGFVTEGGTLDPAPTGTPHYSGDFCVTAGEDGVPDGRIIGLQVAGTRWVNPHPCAQDALAAEQRQLDSTHERPAGTLADSCDSPPCVGGDDIDIQFEMDDQTITLAPDDPPVTQVTIAGRARFSFAGFEDDGPVDHAFITTWVRSEEGPIDFREQDIQRYYDLDSGTNVVTKDIASTVALPPEIGDPAPGEATETEFLGRGLFGLERAAPEDGQQNIGDWRANDPMILRIERLSAGSTGEIEADWEDCETVTLMGPDEDLEELVVYLMRCFDDPGLGCPDGAQVTIENPELPLTLDRDRLAVGDEPYYIDAVEYVGAVQPDHTEPPDDFDCGFEEGDRIEAWWTDCETVTLIGPDENVEELEVYLMRCFEDPGLGCPDGAQVTIETPELPLTLDRDRLAVGDEPYYIDAVEYVGAVQPDHTEPPDDFDCSFE